jgi:hypothetical protein
MIIALSHHLFIPIIHYVNIQVNILDACKYSGKYSSKYFSSSRIEHNILDACKYSRKKGK